MPLVKVSEQTFSMLVTVKDDQYNANGVEAELITFYNLPAFCISQPFPTGEQIQHHFKRHWNLVEASLSISSLWTHQKIPRRLSALD
jgi:hypothetical protein